MTAQDILNYYMNNPPFEITDKVKYAEFLQFQSNSTMMDLSENDPAISEHTFTTTAAIGNEEYILHDITTINEQLMEFIVLEKSADIIDVVQYVCRNSNNAGYLMPPSSTTLSAAYKSGSLANLLAMNDYINIIEDWYNTKITHMIYDSKYMKLLPSTEYYALFRRYKNVTELKQSDLRHFRALLDMNIMLSIYQSDTFASEGGIRSVSLSGLSVSFNVPEAAGKVKDLQNAKTKLLSSLALDYGDDCVGLI